MVCSRHSRLKSTRICNLNSYLRLYNKKLNLVVSRSVYALKETRSLYITNNFYSTFTGISKLVNDYTARACITLINTVRFYSPASTLCFYDTLFLPKLFYSKFLSHFELLYNFKEYVGLATLAAKKRPKFCILGEAPILEFTYASPKSLASKEHIVYFASALITATDTRSVLKEYCASVIKLISVLYLLICVI